MTILAKNKVKIFKKPKSLPVKNSEIIDWFNDILLINSIAGVQLNIIFVTLPEIQNMNRKFRKKDKPTDVITFSMVEGKFTQYSYDMLGDIYVCPDFIKAKDSKSVLRRLIHGLLHLLGNDHKGESDLKKFIILEEKYLKLIKLD
jgi:probable rRNA maturation factor